MRVARPIVLAELLRSPARTGVRVLTLALAVGLLAAMLLFVGHSLGAMTNGAVRTVPLDWQGPVANLATAQHVARVGAAQPGVLTAEPTATAPFAELQHNAPAGLIRSGAGSVLAVTPTYLQHLHTFRFLRGSLEPGHIVLDQQLAATLQAAPGDTVVLTARRGRKPLRLRVSGIALVTAPDTLFQPLNPLLGPAPAQPPAEIAILPLTTFASRVAPQLQSIATGSGASAVPGAQTGTQWQVQAQIDPAALSGSPSTALTQATTIRRRVERSLPGKVVFVDNLGDTLSTAAGDALYAETLFIMLAVPGAIVALALAYLAALGTLERDRRSTALLRARGANRRDLVVLTVLESLLLAIPAAVLGTALAVLAIHWTGSAGGVSSARILVTFGICTLLAAGAAAATRIAAGLLNLRSVRDDRLSVRRESKPLWEKLFLDFVCLGIAGLVYWLTARTGFSAVVNPDSNPTLSLSVYMFLAPALLWIGAALLLLRLRGKLIGWLTSRAVGDHATTTPQFMLASASRRASAVNRGLLVLGLLLAFGVSLSLFVETYNQQAQVDAQLTLGADVVVNAPAGAIVHNNLARRVASLPGVSDVSAVDHTYAYVGPDLQDTFGIDVSTLTRGTSLRDSYFLGGSARQMLQRLRTTKDGVLVSKETVTDYGLSLGDLLRLRILDHRTGMFTVAPFHVVGIVQEFPAAPKDSFMVANLAYLERQGHGTGPNVLFVHANGDVQRVARTVTAMTARYGTRVDDIHHQTAQTVSSITTVDLRGISRIEEAFVLVLAAAAIALIVAVAYAERRPELATMSALGASVRRVAAFLWSEAALVLCAALVLAALLGWLVAELLVAMLQHVFDPPPTQLAVPWSFLALLAGVAVASGVVASWIATRRIRRMPLGAILREE